MEHWLDRTKLLIGEEKLDILSKSTVLVAGLGGVGSYAAEMLARAGVSHLILVDHDKVSVTNINRQLPALVETVGRLKTHVMKERLLTIHPGIHIESSNRFLDQTSLPEVLDNMQPDYVVDAIDTVSSKASLIRYFLQRNIPVVSSMGAGARIDATAVRIADISKTYNCPLAAMIRKRLRKWGIHSGCKAVFSTELPNAKAVLPFEDGNKKSIIGTISYLPAVFGCVCAQVALCDLLKIPNFDDSFK